MATEQPCGDGNADWRDEFFAHVKVRAALAKAKYGPHPSVEFALCRLVEEVGELSQAATSISLHRDHSDRRARILDESVDVVATVLRLLEEFPSGLQQNEETT